MGEFIIGFIMGGILGIIMMSILFAKGEDKE